MKQGTTFTMPVYFEGLDTSKVEKIEFIWKRYLDYTEKPVKTATYPTDVTLEGELYMVPWTMTETYEVGQNTMLYMDARIKYKGSTDMPPVPCVRLSMLPTLFNKEG